MSYNGSGIYTLPGAQLVNGEIVSATENNNFRNDVATALNTAWTRDGQSTATGNIPMGSHKFTGMLAGSVGTDSITLGQTQAGAYAYLGSVAGTNTVTATVSPTFAAYTAGQVFRFIAAGSNTGATTININSVGAKNIYKNGSTPLEVGDIISGSLITVIYDGTQFQLQAGTGSGGAAAGGSIFVNYQTVSSNYTIAAGQNGGSFGPITIADGVTVTVSNGSVWSIV